MTFFIYKSNFEITDYNNVYLEIHLGLEVVSSKVKYLSNFNLNIIIFFILIYSNNWTLS